jgi:hypothetical protein
MPGTLIQDALAPVLHDGTTAITSATTTTGTGQPVDQPGEVAIELAVGTITGSSLVCTVEIQGSDVLAFSSGVVSYGRFAAIDEDSDDETRYLSAYVDKAYMRSVIVTSGTVTSVVPVITVREPHDRRVAGWTA